MKHTGPPPFGFIWKDDGLCVLEKEAEIRRLAFEWYAEMQSKGAVAKRLNSAGHQTRRGGNWRDVTVSRLLVCSSARGLYAINKTSTDDAGERIEKPEEEWEFIECPPLVSPELWERVQAVLVGELPSPSASGIRSHPFTGLLFCHCGARMNLASSAPKFVCGKCGDRIPVRDLEDRFLDEATSFLRARQTLAAEFIAGDQSVAEQRKLLREAGQKAQQLEAQIAQAGRLYMDKRISLERFEKMHRPLEDERRAAQRELGRIKAKLSRLEAKGPAAETSPAFDLDTLRKRWSTFTNKDQRNIAQLLMSRIVVAKDEIEFTCRFRDSSERTAKAQHVPGPTSSSPAGENEPIYIRLPKAGQLCPRTGMTRSALNELILQTERNHYRPPVESKSLRKREGGKGTRLIVWQSLKDFLSRGA